WTAARAGPWRAVGVDDPGPAELDVRRAVGAADPPGPALADLGLLLAAGEQDHAHVVGLGTEAGPERRGGKGEKGRIGVFRQRALHVPELLEADLRLQALRAPRQVLALSGSEEAVRGFPMGAVGADQRMRAGHLVQVGEADRSAEVLQDEAPFHLGPAHLELALAIRASTATERSEERRVGKECRAEEGRDRKSEEWYE